ncbi:MAG: UDP-glucose 4-epimerase GalE [Clostridiales bacterium]|nr:UDP-glucose 4-epimerase GalE [Clostridiales bacterium]
MAVLVTGGAGYIGSHMVAELLENGIETVVIDNLSTGNRAAVLCEKFYKGDIRNAEDLERVFVENKIDSVIHFAASSLVGESIYKPLKYYNNNVHGTSVLLAVMKKYGVKNIVFSSSAAVYGEVKKMPITEETPVNPKSPYGETKLVMEKMIDWVSQSAGFKYVSLRYFNACGAHKSGEIGEWRKHETHLIPIVLQYVMGLRDSLKVFGNDYETPDGTCIRDYIHVVDLAKAHIAALKYLENGGTSEVFNLGMGKGFSVLEIIKAAEKVVGKEILYDLTERRAGDPAILIASNSKAIKKLGWVCNFEDPEEIIENAWNFYKRHPKGYN